MKKKLISLLLVVTICLSMGTVALGDNDASNYETRVTENVVTYSGQTYFKSEEFVEFCDNIYVSDGQYLMAVEGSEDNSLVPVERVDVAFSDNASVTNFLNRSDIPQEAKDSFLLKYQAYKESEGDYETAPTLTFFEPDNTVTTRSEPGLPEEENIFHYNYNGWDMMTYLYIYEGLSTGWKNIERGRNTKDLSASAYDVAITIASEMGSEVAKRLSFISTGVSVLTAFLRTFGYSATSVSENVDDYFQARLYWDQAEKYTMTDFGGMASWQVGLVTYKVNIRELGTELYFADTGHLNTHIKDYNEVVKSPHYDNPWKTAFDRGAYNPLWEYISWDACGVEYSFN